MQIEGWNLRREEVVFQDPSFILNTRIFNKGKTMALFCSNGQVHIYSHERRQWIQKSSTKLFECPIVANDVIQHVGNLQIAMIGYDGAIKIANLTSQFEVIVFEQYNFHLDSPIICCTWSSKPNELLISTQSREIVVINVLQNKHNHIKLKEDSEGQGLTLIRRGKNAVFLSCGTRIRCYQVTAQISKKSVEQSVMLTIKENIIDFLVSEDEMYNSLIILTPTRLIFFLFEEQIAKMTEKMIQTTANCSKLGWGRNFSQIGLYQSVNGRLETHCFYKNITGMWQEEHIPINIHMDMND